MAKFPASGGQQVTADGKMGPATKDAINVVRHYIKGLNQSSDAQILAWLRSAKQMGVF
jgi:hypothetical protein